MKLHPLALVARRILKFTVPALCLLIARPTLALPDDLPSGFPQIQLQQKLHGDAAIAALGNKLPAVAAFYKKSEQELQKLLRQDSSLWVDQRGRLFHVCNFGLPPINQTAANDFASPSLGPFPYEDTFRLHSKAGASKVIFLDFDGHDASSTIWGSDAIGRPFDIDGSPFTFSTTERDRIQYIWQRVAEDFIQYDVDVTTEDPGVEALQKINSSDTNFGIRAVIAGSSSDWYGSAGGVAYVGSFDDSTDLPCWIFPKSLGPDNEKYVAEAISHEVGHTLGLSHDGLTDGTTYYSGQGNWAPIMGVGYYENIVHWSKGEYLNANQTQDDLAIMPTYGPPYRTDDHGNTNTTATTLVGVSFVTNGIIERTTDVDFFSFQTGAGKIAVSASPAPRGPNLHIFLSLYDSGGNLIASTNSTDTSAGVQPVTLTNTLAAGTYYFSVDGVGSANPLTDGYSDYSSIGQYTVTGTLPSDSGWLPTAAGTSYSWSDAANWSSNTIPLGADAVARIVNNIMGDQTIDLNTTVTLGKLFLGDANGSHSFTLENGAGGPFIFKTTFGNALISKTAGANDIIAATTTLQSDIVVSNTTASDLSFTGAINGSGSLTKRGVGRLTLAGTNTYNGSTVVGGGTLALASTATIASTNLHVQSGAVLDATALAGGLLLSASQTLGGDGAVVGDIIAPGGARISPGSNGIPATLNFTNNLALNNGAALKFDLANSTTPGGGTNDLLVVSNLNLSGTISVDFNFLNQMPASPATYTLIRYTGTLTGDAGNFSSANYSNCYAFTFDDTAPGEIRVQVSGSPVGLVWQGDGSLNRWDVAGASNWLNGATPEKFFQLDSVTFDNTGSISPSVSLLGTLKPVAVTVNSSSNFTFAGSGKISGDATLTKQGTGTLTVNATNDYSGATLVSGGTLKAGNAAALGSATGTTTISSGARLDLNSQNLGAEAVTAAGIGPDGFGAIINSSATAQSNALRFITLSGDTTFGGTGRWDIRANPTASFAGNNFNLTKTNANEVWFVNVGASGLGNINVNQGVFGLQGSSTPGNSANTVTIEPAGTLALFNTDYNTVNKKLMMNGGTFRSDAGNNILSGTVTLKATNTFNVAAGLELQGAIDGTGAIAKTGSGTLSLTASNIFDGAVLINVGTLRAGNGWALGSTNAGTIIASNARLDVNAQNLGAEPITAIGDGLGNAGAIVSMNTSAQNNALRFVTFTGHTTFGGIGRWDIRANPTASLTGNNFNLTKTGPNEVWLVDAGPSGLGNITVSEGTLGFQGNTTMGSASSNITVNSSCTLGINSTGTNALSKVVSLNTARVNNASGANVFMGTVSLSGSNAFDISPTTTLTLSNTVSSSGTLYKLSPGTLIFAGANTYSGATTISSGILQIGNGGATGTTGTGNITNNASLTFNRSNDFTTANLIVGSGGVTKLGAGTLTLSGANSFSNTTTISAGTLKIGNASALGVTNAGTTVANGATLDVNGFSLGAEGITVQGAGVGGNGAIISTGAAQANALRYVTLNGNTTFGGTGNWDIRDPGAGGSSALTGAFNLTKVGANQIWLANLGSTSLSDIVISNGLLGIQGTTTLGNAAKSLSISNGTMLAISATGANTLNKILLMNAGRINNTSGANTFTGSSGTLSSSNVFDIATGTSLTVSEPLGGSGSLNKISAGTLNLNANNGYTGPTIITAGTLALGSSGAISSSAGIEVDSGALFDVSAVAGFAVSTGQLLLGNGTVNGNVTVNGNLSPGLSIGRLTFNNSVTLSGTTTMEISKTGAVTNDSISVAGALIYGGALVVTHSGNPISASDVFPLFNAGSRSGSFSSTNLPVLSPALRWNTSYLPVDGTLRVTLVSSPQMLPPLFDGTNFIVQVQSDLGVNYILECATNLNSPTIWSSVSTNIGTGGLLSISTPWQSSDLQKFFRLVAY